MKGQAKSKIIQDALNNIDPKREKLINELLDNFESIKAIEQAKKREIKLIHKIKWFNKMNLEQQFYKTIEANNVINGDRTRHPHTLKNYEIEKIFDYHETNKQNETNR